MPSQIIKIGTRGSPLALWQANEVRAQLMKAHGLDAEQVRVCTFQTTGDRIQDKSLREFGGKGLFTKEIEDALLAGEIHMAVHSMKDMATALPDGLGISCVLERADVRDAFLSLRATSIADLPQGARVGSSSLRRQAQIRKMRPDLEVIEFRGNVQTRLRKLEDGVADATLLAAAGLTRLGMQDRIAGLIETDAMLPAVAQGAICVETRIDDEETKSLLDPVNHTETESCVAIERAYLAELDGSCRTPIAGLATLEADQATFRGQILAPDGSASYETERTGSAEEGPALGIDAARELLDAAGPGFLSGLS